MKKYSNYSVFIISALCFISVLLILLFSIMPVAYQVNFESGDFAANSILIQQAKNVWLLTGNYSRVGFNHPGPAILYVLASGEYFLFDKLRLVSSAFSGQIVAVVAYNAFWATLLFRMLLIQLQRLDHALLAFLTLMAGIALADHQIFNGIWFPHLYVMPFCVVLMALTVTITGNVRFLPTLALATGFLVNGHVSFIPFLFVLFILSYVVTLFTQGVRAGSLSRQLIARENRDTVISAFIIICLFFVPVIILTITEFPGPVADYAKFGGQHITNTVSSSLKYISVYWGGWYEFVISIFFSALLFYINYVINKNKYIYYSIIIVILTTFCLFMYVRYGVDMLDQTYIGEYYYAIPPFLASVVVIALLSISGKRIVLIVGVPFGIICATLFIVQVFKPTSYQSIYNDRGGLEVYEKLRVAKSDGRIVLDLAMDNHWGNTWSTILGAEVIAARAGEELFCVNQGWHISFTKKAKCTPHEVENNVRYTVQHVSLPSVAADAESFSAQSLRFERWKQPELINKGQIQVSSNPDIFGQYILESGWSSVGSQFVWSVGPEAALSLHVGKGFTGVAILDLSAFLPKQGLSQTVEISGGSSLSVRQEFTTDNLRHLVNLPIKNADRDVIDVRIKIAAPRSPKDLGISDDPREIGIALYGVEIQEQE